MSIPKNPQTIEGVFFLNGWKGDTLISTKTQTNLTSYATLYKRKIKIEKCIVISNIVGHKATTEIAYKITILDDTKTKKIVNGTNRLKT